MTEEEFRRELSLLQPNLISWALNRVRSFEDAEDLVQDTLVRALQSWETFDAKRGCLRSWVSSIMRNRSIDLNRSRNARLQTISTEEVGSELSAYRMPATQHAHAELMEGVRIVGTLPDTAQDVLALIFTGYTERQVAAMRNLPLGIVKSHIRISRMKAQERLAFS